MGHTILQAVKAKMIGPVIYRPKIFILYLIVPEKIRHFYSIRAEIIGGGGPIRSFRSAKGPGP